MSEANMDIETGDGLYRLIMRLLEGRGVFSYGWDGITEPDRVAFRTLAKTIHQIADGARMLQENLQITDKKVDELESQLSISREAARINIAKIQMMQEIIINIVKETR